MDNAKVIEGLKKLKFSYNKIDEPEGKPVQFVGVYVLKWGKVDVPSVGFTELDEEQTDIISQAIQALQSLSSAEKELNETKITQLICCAVLDIYPRINNKDIPLGQVVAGLENLKGETFVKLLKPNAEYIAKKVSALCTPIVAKLKAQIKEYCKAGLDVSKDICEENDKLKEELATLKDDIIENGMKYNDEIIKNEVLQNSNKQLKEWVDEHPRVKALEAELKEIKEVHKNIVSGKCAPR